jgi:5'-nucleotidase
VERIDPRGGKYYWIGGDDLGFDKEDGTDCMAIHEGYISVTPLQVDMTNYRSFQEIKALMFPWP